MIRILLICFLCFLVMPLGADAQSFDCRKAKYPDERAICNNSQLAEFDVQMSNEFYRLLNSLTGLSRARLSSEQGEWLHERRYCGSNVFCLRARYQERIDELGAYALVPAPPLSKGTELRAVGILANEVLNIREYPTDQSHIIDIIPPNATGIVYLGETQGQWIFVQYERSTGWVDRNFVMPVTSRGEHF